MLNNIDIKFFRLAIGNDSIGKETDVDISARCPICSSDERWKNTRRLHLYEKNGVTNVNCFTGDCICKNKTVYSFLRDHHPGLLGQYKRENFSNTLESLASGADVFANFKQEPTKIIADITTHDLTPYLKPIEESNESIDYLEKRGFSYNEELFGKWYFGYQDLKIGETIYPITNSIIIPLYYNKEMYGFYSRNIYKKDFYTYNPEQNIGFKVWNWFNIDKNKPVYIFEGIFDAMSSGLTNIIALMGAKIPEDRLKELKKPVFVLDNDKSGFINSLEYANKGYDVYIQPNEYIEKDMNELKLNHPKIKPKSIIMNNIFTGIMAEVRIKSKL